MAALNCYAEAMAVDPASSAAYGRMGDLMSNELGEPELAEDALRTAVELEPSRASSWNGIGKLLHARGTLDAASDALAVAVSLSPSDGELLQNLATVLRAQCRFDESSQLLRGAIETEAFGGDEAEAAGDDGETGQAALTLAFAPERVAEAGATGEAPTAPEAAELAAQALDHVTVMYERHALVMSQSCTEY